MPRLDPADLRTYATRDRGAPERLSQRARGPAEEKARIAVELYEAARTDWPDTATRREDLVPCFEEALRDAADTSVRGR